MTKKFATDKLGYKYPVFLQPGVDPDDEVFFDMEKKALPVTRYADLSDLTVECALCFGYGGWRLELNAYGPGKHFDATCSNCNGWGYVNPAVCDGVTVQHNFKTTHTANCYWEGVCTTCGMRKVIDSSG